MKPRYLGITAKHAELPMEVGVHSWQADPAVSITDKIVEASCLLGRELHLLNVFSRARESVRLDLLLPVWNRQRLAGVGEIWHELISQVLAGYILEQQFIEGEARLSAVGIESFDDLEIGRARLFWNFGGFLLNNSRVVHR